MNKMAKLFVAGTFVFGSALGMNITNAHVSHSKAQAETTQPWYTYDGYTSKGGDFVLDQSFFNGLKYGNMTFNDIKVNSKYDSETGSKVIYDQTFEQTNGKVANSVTFDIQPKAVSLKDIRLQYGENYKYQPPLNGSKESSSDGLYGYQVGKGHIVFHVTDGYVTSAVVS